MILVYTWPLPIMAHMIQGPALHIKAGKKEGLVCLSHVRAYCIMPIPGAALAALDR